MASTSPINISPPASHTPRRGFMATFPENDTNVAIMVACFFSAALAVILTLVQLLHSWPVQTVGVIIAAGPTALLYKWISWRLGSLIAPRRHPSAVIPAVEPKFDDQVKRTEMQLLEQRLKHLEVQLSECRATLEGWKGEENR